MTDPLDSPRAPRPVAITVICVIAGLGLCLGLVALAVRWDVMQRLPTGHQAAALAAPLVILLSIAGYWRMRRWAAWLLAAGLALRLLATLAGWLPLAWGDVGLPLLMLAVGAAYWRRLS